MIKNILKIISLFAILVLSGCTRYYEKHCNLFSTDESALCVAALVGALPVAMMKYPSEKKKEDQRVQEFIAKRNLGVMQGDREALEHCAQYCHMSTRDSDEDIALSKLASEKLIQLDDPKKIMTMEQTKAIIVAYSSLQYELSFSDPLKAQYVKRAWSLVGGVMEKNEYYKIDGSSLDVIGGMAYLFNDRLIHKNVKEAENVFAQCMFDPFWKEAHFELASLEVMNFCQVSVNWYSHVSTTADKAYIAQLKEKLKVKWQAEWDDASKKKYPNKS